LVIELGNGELQDREHPAAPPSVEILGTQRMKILSSIVGQEYELDINLPRNYKDTTRRFPVIYLLDSQWDFPLVNAVFGGQYYDGFVPELIIVGITWGGKNPKYDSLRARDYTPTTIQQVPYSGNGPKFLEFIKKELIPFVESKYRTVKDDRGLMGSSLGGLFTLYAMFHETALFNRYILTSPALGWDKDTTFTYEKNYAGKNKGLPVRLFMGIGGLEFGIPQFRKFVDQLKSRNYDGLDLQTWVMEGMGHSGSKPEGYARGLQAMFPRPAVKIDHAILDSYAGKYQMNPQVAITISREDDNLVLLAPDGTKVKLDAEAKNDFYLKGTYLFLKFEKDDKGKVTGLHVEQFEGGGSLKKVE
jgi:predicted alpha/beta superfamily hydrolase